MTGTGKEKEKGAQQEKAQGRRKGEWDLFSPVNSTLGHKHIQSFYLQGTGTILVSVCVCL